MGSGGWGVLLRTWGASAQPFPFLSPGVNQEPALAQLSPGRRGGLQATRALAGIWSEGRIWGIFGEEAVLKPQQRSLERRDRCEGGP